MKSFIYTVIAALLLTITSAQNPIQITNPTVFVEWSYGSTGTIAWNGNCAGMGANARSVGIGVGQDLTEGGHVVANLGTLDCSTNSSISVSVPAIPSGNYQLKVDTLPEPSFSNIFYIHGNSAITITAPSKQTITTPAPTTPSSSASAPPLEPTSDAHHNLIYVIAGSCAGGIVIIGILTFVLLRRRGTARKRAAAKGAMDGALLTKGKEYTLLSKLSKEETGGILVSGKLEIDIQETRRNPQACNQTPTPRSPQLYPEGGSESLFDLPPSANEAFQKIIFSRHPRPIFVTTVNNPHANIPRDSQIVHEGDWRPESFEVSPTEVIALSPCSTVLSSPTSPFSPTSFSSPSDTHFS